VILEPVPVPAPVPEPVVDLEALTHMQEDMKRLLAEKLEKKRESEAREEAEKQTRLAAKLKAMEEKKKFVALTPAAAPTVEDGECRGDFGRRVSELEKRREVLMNRNSQSGGVSSQQQKP
jgi:hypothetical protein